MSKSGPQDVLRTASELDLLLELVRRAGERNYGRCDYCGRLRLDADDPVCDQPQRHRQALTVSEALESGK